MRRRFKTVVEIEAGQCVRVGGIGIGIESFRSGGRVLLALDLPRQADVVRFETMVHRAILKAMGAPVPERSER